MDTNDEAGPAASGAKKPLQLPVSCDPPGPNNPVKQKAWIVCEPSELIFGGTGQMGRSVVKAALAHGDIVTSVGRTHADNLATMRLAGSLSSASAGASPQPAECQPLPNLLCLLCDVRVRSSVERVFKQHLEHWGDRLDVVANCSTFGVFGSCEDQDDSDLRQQFEVNFWGTVHIVQLSLPHLRTHGGGRYLIFSSTSGALGVPGLGPYCATKYAVEGLVESMLYEIEPFDIKATLVSPGHVRRDDPDDVEADKHKEDRSNVLPNPATHTLGVAKGGALGPGAFSSPAYGSFVIRPASAPYAGPNSPAGHAKRVVQWIGNQQPTSVVRSAEVIWQLAHCSYPPLRLLLGNFAVESVRDRLRTIMEEIEDWKFLSFGEDLDVEKARERIAGREPQNQDSSDEDDMAGTQHQDTGAEGQRDRSNSFDVDENDYHAVQYDDDDDDSMDGSDTFDNMEEG